MYDYIKNYNLTYQVTLEGFICDGERGLSYFAGYPGGTQPKSTFASGSQMLTTLFISLISQRR